MVCAETTIVFADDHAPLRGMLQSRLNEVWAAFFSSSLKSDLRYGPSDCFENLPLPAGLNSNRLAVVAAEYQDHRAAMMQASKLGLTKTYNRFHDPSDRKPDIQRLRDLHHELDLAVLQAYGWDDLAERAAPEFLSKDNELDHRYQKRLFWPAPFRDEVLTRLLAENEARAARELALGLAPPSPEPDDDVAA